MKIAIVGCVASGKTTLSKKLSKHLGIPCFEGDSIAHGFDKNNRYKHSHDEQKQVIEEINKNEKWIIEGCYRESQRLVYQLADIVIFLETHISKRRWRIIKRFIKHKLGIEQSNYKPTFKMFRLMFKWNIDFENNKSDIISTLEKLNSRIVYIKSEKELKEQGFL